MLGIRIDVFVVRLCGIKTFEGTGDLVVSESEGGMLVEWFTFGFESATSRHDLYCRCFEFVRFGGAYGVAQESKVANQYPVQIID